MKYGSLPAFDRDLARLPREQRELFLVAVRTYFLPAIAAGTFTGSPQWPRRLRIHRLTDSAIYSLTWNVAAPDGRATFHLERSADDEAILVWRRIGDHSIYERP